MPPLPAMPKRKGSEWGSDQPTRELSFITIDDCIQAAQELWSRLRQLGEYKHPLDVRKGVILSMADKDDSKTLKASSRTYFFDLKQTKEGKHYLLITESRMKTNQRNQIAVFPEEAPGFLAAVQEMAGKMG